MPVDILARKAYTLDHIIPVWLAMPVAMRGNIYLTAEGMKYLSDHPSPFSKIVLGSSYLQEYLDGDNSDCGHFPILTSAYGDACRVAEFDPNRPIILMEHGIGLTFGKPVYADGYGQRYKFSLFPVPNQHTLDKCHPDMKKWPHPIIGVPKMDPFAGEFKKPHPMPKNPTIAIAFHHGDKNSRPGEVGSAWEHYQDIIPRLANFYKVIFHAHPILNEQLATLIVKDHFNGAEFVPDFNEVMRRADIYINDCSSTLYEFAVTGKPVIMLNAPWFDRKSNFGIRFWDYTDIGPQVDEPTQLIPAIQQTIAKPDEFEQARWRMVNDLFPFLGSSADRAVMEIETFLGKQESIVSKPEPKPKPLAVQPMKIRTSADRGLLYMCFGDKALAELKKSVESLRKAGCTLPLAVIGAKESITGMNGLTQDILEAKEWKGQNPFDGSKANRFQFRAGRVKPSLYELSPFRETMYVDCDVEFRVDPEPGFGFLKHWDFCVAQERLAVNQLYNRERSGWQHNIEEKNQTIQEFGDGNFPFINSGVLFWRNNWAVKELFRLWAEEWNRWQQWDEQMSLVRALNRSSVRMFLLSEVWNYPHRDELRALIVHEYGLGAARMDVRDHEKE
jgi:hypothetical protein